MSNITDDRKIKVLNAWNNEWFLQIKEDRTENDAILYMISMTGAKSLYVD